MSTAAPKMQRRESTATETTLDKSEVADEKAVAKLEAINEDEEKIIEDTVNAAVNHEYSEAELKRVMRKVDWILLPIMWLLYGLQQADKVSISVQSTFGIRKDLNMVGQDYAWLSTIFYLSYLVGELPGNVLMQRVNIGRTLGCAALIWGLIVMSVAWTHTWAELMVIRTLQGLAECTISPAYLLITQAWYTRREHAFRLTIWATANSGLNIICGFADYGIAQAALAHPKGLAAWRAISYFLGGITIVAGILALVFLGTPRELWWLSEEEKRMVAARTAANAVGTDRIAHKKWDWLQVRDAFVDPQTYLLFFLVVSNSIPNGGALAFGRCEATVETLRTGTTTFGNLVYVGIGLTPLTTITEGTIPYHVVTGVLLLLGGYLSMKFKGWRLYIMAIPLIPAFIGCLLTALLPKDQAHLWDRWGTYLMTAAGNIVGALIWTLVPSNVAVAQKSITLTVLFVAYCFGNAVGAQVFQERWAPDYGPSLVILAVFFGLEVVLMMIWRFYFVYENRRRDRIVAGMGLSADEIAAKQIQLAEKDTTDLRNIFSRYDY